MAVKYGRPLAPQTITNDIRASAAKASLMPQSATKSKPFGPKVGSQAARQTSAMIQRKTREGKGGRRFGSVAPQSGSKFAGKPSSFSQKKDYLSL